MIKAICVYCGSNPGAATEYAETARAVGAELARNNIRLVYGGGHVGLMGMVADACIDTGGQVTGIIPDFLNEKEKKHQKLQERKVT